MVGEHDEVEASARSGVRDVGDRHAAVMTHVRVHMEAADRTCVGGIGEMR